MRLMAGPSGLAFFGKKESGGDWVLRRIERRGITAINAVLLYADRHLGEGEPSFVDGIIIKNALAVIMTWKCGVCGFLNGKVTERQLERFREFKRDEIGTVN